MNERVLIVGADSLIGGALFRELREKDVPVIGTSRRNDSAFLHLNLAAPIDYSGLPEADVVFMGAGINGFAACGKDVVSASLVNVTSTLAIANYYMRRGSYLVFPSSTAVFGAMEGVPVENAQLAPNTTYGAFKCATEIALLDAVKATQGKCAIVRLTKVLSRSNPLIMKWLDAGNKGESIEAFCDVQLSPISLTYVIRSLLEVMRHPVTGCLHLSGEQTLSYFDLAHGLRNEGILPLPEIRSVHQAETGTAKLQNACARLDMSETSRLTGVQPQAFRDFLGDMTC